MGFPFNSAVLLASGFCPFWLLISNAAILGTWFQMRQVLLFWLFKGLVALNLTFFFMNYSSLICSSLFSKRQKVIGQLTQKHGQMRAFFLLYLHELSS